MNTLAPPYNPNNDSYQQQSPADWNAPQGPAPSYSPPPYSGGPPSPNADHGSEGQPQQPPMFVPPPMAHGGFASHPDKPHDQDCEANLIKPATLQFDHKSVRAAFVRKVFMLLSIQLLIVVALIALFLFEPHCKLYVQRNAWLYYVSYATFFISYLCIICCECVRSYFPGNLICLFVLTIAMGYMTAMISSYYDTVIVFIAAGICALCCGSIIIFACQTKYDFTRGLSFMFVVLMVLFFFGLAAILCTVVFKLKVVYAVYAGIAALVFMIFLVMDTQMIIGQEFSPEEYILAAVQLFMDIILIFLYLLQLLFLD